MLSRNGSRFPFLEKKRDDKFYYLAKNILILIVNKYKLLNTIF